MKKEDWGYYIKLICFLSIVIAATIKFIGDLILS